MLYYNGGDIWFEHLDGLYERDDLVIAKLTADLPQLTRPSMTSFVCFVFLETTVNDLILLAVKQAVLRSNKPFSKIAFCGLNKEYRKSLRTNSKIMDSV